MNISALSVIIVQIFWLGLVLVGYVFVVALQKKYDNKFICDWKKIPFAGRMLIAAATAFLSFCIFTIVGYALKLSGWWLSFSYLTTLLCAVLLCSTYIRKEFLFASRQILPGVRSFKLFSPTGLLAIVLVADFIISLRMGMNLGGDSPVHVSKIKHLIDQGFTIEDAFYGGVPETRHHISIMHTLFAIPAWFKVTPYQSWFLSAAFFKLLKSFAIYFLAWRFTEKFKPNVRLSVAAGSTIFSLAFFSSYAIGLPTEFVSVWVILLTLGLLEATRGKSYWLTIMASALVAMTHSLGAISAIMALGASALGLLLFCRQYVTKKIIYTFIASGALLLTTPLFTLTLPNQISSAAWDSGADKFSYFYIGGLQALKPTLEQFSRIYDLPIVSAISIVGLVYVLSLLRKRSEKIVVASLTFIVPLVLNNPLLFDLLHKVMPIWAIERLSGANQLFYLYLPFGIFGVAALILKQVGRLKIDTRNYLVGSVVFCLSILAIPFFNSINSLKLSEPQTQGFYISQQKYLVQISDVQAIAPGDPEAVVLADDTKSLILPAVSRAHVLAIRDARATPAADNEQRRECSSLIQKSLAPELLKQVNVKYILAGDASALNIKARQSSYLKLVRRHNKLILYEFKSSNVQPSNNPKCEFNE